MAGGRPRKPTALKLLTGNPGKRALPKHEPKPRAVSGLLCPDWMPDEGRALWARLEPLLSRLGVLTEADAEALAVLCDSWAEWLAARAVVREQGATYFSQRGEAPRPEVRIADAAAKRFVTLLGRFGLTPADRAKVTAVALEEVDPMDELLAERGA